MMGCPALRLPLNLLLIVREKPRDEKNLKVLAPVRLSFEESSKKVTAVFRKGRTKSFEKFATAPLWPV